MKRAEISWKFGGGGRPLRHSCKPKWSTPLGLFALGRTFWSSVIERACEVIAARVGKSSRHAAAPPTHQ